MSVNLTLSVDDRLLERAREVARRQGVSLNQLIRQYLEAVAGEVDGAAVADRLLRLMEEHGGHSGGRTVRRGWAYEGRL
ncbi:MAG: ribbon-helix-helix protein, CopG family [Nitrospirae bacterium]|nr:MAG: ribbon-helix-helix protein, CopG family [Nitrospirota bacterium]